MSKWQIFIVQMTFFALWSPELIALILFKYATFDMLNVKLRWLLGQVRNASVYIVVYNFLNCELIVNITSIFNAKKS